MFKYPSIYIYVLFCCVWFVFNLLDLEIGHSFTIYIQKSLCDALSTNQRCSNSDSRATMQGRPLWSPDHFINFVIRDKTSIITIYSVTTVHSTKYIRSCDRKTQLHNFLRFIYANKKIASKKVKRWHVYYLNCVYWRHTIHIYICIYSFHRTETTFNFYMTTNWIIAIK